MKSLRELFVASDGGEGFSPERLQSVGAALVTDHRNDMPWYLRIIVGIGAWLASLFFLAAAFSVFGWFGSDEAAIGWIGAVLLPIAVVVGRCKWGVFAEQCSLAVSFAAQAMIYIGFLDKNTHPMAAAAALSVAFAVVLYLVYPVFISRLVTCFAALQITLIWIYSPYGDPFFGGGPVQSELSRMLVFYWGLQLAALIWCFLKAPRPILFAPLGYALVASLAAWQAEDMWRYWSHYSVITYDIHAVQWLIGHLRMIFTAGALFAVAVWAAGGKAVLQEKATLFAGFALALAVLIWLGAGLVLLALLFLLLGFSLQDRAILTLGVVLFPVFLTHYYYNLQLDLLAKSGVLIGSGALLLLLRTGLARTVFAETKEAA